MSVKKPPRAKARAKKPAAPSRKAATAAVKPAGGGADSLALLVRFGAATADVLRARPGTIPAPRRELREPLVTPATFTTIPPGGGEIWAAFYDAKLRPLGVNAWSRRPKYFGDAPDRRSKVPGAMRGGMMKPRFDDRFLHLEVPRGAAYLLFLRNRVVSVGRRAPHEGKGKPLVGTGPYGDVRLEWEMLGAYSLKDREDRILKEPLPFPFPFGLDRLELMAVLAEIRAIRDWWTPVDVVVSRGRIVDEQTVLDNGDPSGHFNIVITGDGFLEGELGEFEARAMRIVDGIQAAKPFSDLVPRLNIHLIYAASLVSGIQYAGGSIAGASSGSTPTYYGVEGSWPDPTLPEGYSSYAGYCGISDAWRVYDAAKNFAPADQIQLFIMLAKCPVDGGSAFHDQRMAFITTGTPISELVPMALHESAHVVGNLGEEYISPLPWDGVTSYHNVIDREKREAAWWRQFAALSELDDAQLFKYVHDCPDGSQGSACSLAHNSPYLTQAGDPGHLGLFWGAQFVDSGDSVLNLFETWAWDSAWRDKRGNNFFRGRAGCRMRDYFWPFCEVCIEEMTQIINNPSL